MATQTKIHAIFRRQLFLGKYPSAMQANMMEEEVYLFSCPLLVVKVCGWLQHMLKVHLTPNFFAVEMKLSNIYKNNFPFFSVSDSFKGFKN